LYDVRRQQGRGLFLLGGSGRSIHLLSPDAGEEAGMIRRGEGARIFFTNVFTEEAKIGTFKYFHHPTYGETFFLPPMLAES
jgi:hypothetical protein